MAGEINGLKLGLGRRGFHHYRSNRPEVAAWGSVGGGEEGEGAQRGPEQDGGGGEK